MQRSGESEVRGGGILRGLSGSGLVGRAVRLGVVGGRQQQAGAEGEEGGYRDWERGHSGSLEITLMRGT
jgi:hypothetical protein